MLADLGVVRSHSRPHTSNDNRICEAHFKTLKYQLEFPKRFQTVDEARAFWRRLAAWYNQDHHHAGIGLMTPDQINFGQASAIHAARQTALDTVSQHPEAARPPASRTTPNPDGRLDQPAQENEASPSVNSKTNCLKVVDRFRPAQRRTV